MEGHGSISSHLNKFRRSIFGEDLIFSFENFVPSKPSENDYIEKLKEHLTVLIEKLGGRVVKERILANIWVFYEDNDYARNQINQEF